MTGTRPAHSVQDEALDNLALHEGKKLETRRGAVKDPG